MPATPISPQTQELRLATTMTGGVSLAIWMGGVARELNLLERASGQRKRLKQVPAVGFGTPDHNVEAIYVRLLDLLDTTVDADILAGTSAGGINAALLGLARVNGRDLAPIRHLWLTMGAFETLLRDPKHDAPPSLLQGDAELLEGLKKGLCELWPRDTPTSKPPPTTVRLTTTLIAGETSRFTDAYGTLVADVDHRGLFTFDEKHLSQPEVRPALATAARSSASFPLAFEPGYVGLDDEGDRPGMRGYADITRPHWVADGGLLANRPIGPLLRDIFDRPAERQVRRVLLYVVPSPGAQEHPSPAPAVADLTDPLSAGEALLGDVGAVIGQSIAADLRAFREHNDRVDSQCDTRLRMAQLALRCSNGAPRLVDEAMLDDYRARESDWFVRPLVAALLRDIGARPAAALPQRWTASLEPGQAIEEACRAEAAKVVAAGWSLARTNEPIPYSVLARFGLRGFEGAKGTVIGMLRSAFALERDSDRRTQLAATLAAAHDAMPLTQRPDVVEVVRERIDALLEGGSTGELPEVAALLAVDYWTRANPPHVALAEAWELLGRAARDAREAASLSLTDAEKRTGVGEPLEPLAEIRRDRPSSERAAAELQTYVDFLVGGPKRVAAALLDLHIATRSVLPVAVEVEQPVEFVQISADSRTLLSPRRRASEKLTGVQLHNFGAFYKSSWRASDWAWGRIDGAGWLVHLLLDPRRIDLLTAAGPDRAASFHGRLRAALGLPDAIEPDADPDAVAALAELSFLDNSSTPMPKSLPRTALWAASELQRWIACAELPVVADAINRDDSGHVDPWAAKVFAAARPVETGLGRATGLSPPHVRLGALLQECEVPDETLADQFGTPLFTRTATKAVAVSAALVEGVAKPIGMLRPALTLLRTVTMGSYRAATATRGATRPFLLTGLAALVVGVVVAIYNSSALGLTGAVVATIGFYIVALTTWGWSRKAFAALVTGLALGALLVFGASRHDVFGSAPCTKESCSVDSVGWFGRHVLPWLSASFWHVMLAVVLFFGLATLIGIAAKRSRPRAPTAG